jgi:hypothetical protein
MGDAVVLDLPTISMPSTSDPSPVPRMMPISGSNET